MLPALPPQWGLRCWREEVFSETPTQPGTVRERLNRIIACEERYGKLWSAISTGSFVSPFNPLWYSIVACKCSGTSSQDSVRFMSQWGKGEYLKQELEDSWLLQTPFTSYDTEKGGEKVRWCRVSKMWLHALFLFSYRILKMEEIKIKRVGSCWCNNEDVSETEPKNQRNDFRATFLSTYQNSPSSWTVTPIFSLSFLLTFFHSSELQRDRQTETDWSLNQDWCQDSKKKYILLVNLGYKKNKVFALANKLN